MESETRRNRSLDRVWEAVPASAVVILMLLALAPRAGAAQGQPGARATTASANEEKVLRV